jgi:hypothetical protein
MFALHRLNLRLLPAVTPTALKTTLPHSTVAAVDAQRRHCHRCAKDAAREFAPDLCFAGYTFTLSSLATGTSLAMVSPGEPIPFAFAMISSWYLAGSVCFGASTLYQRATATWIARNKRC